MGNVIHESGDSTKPFTYLLFEQILEALSTMRERNEWGYGWRGQGNKPGRGPRRGKISNGVLIPYVRQTGKGKVYYAREDKSGRTNCSCATSNAIAIALSHSQVEHPKTGDLYYVPTIGSEGMPADFYRLWQLANKKDAQWFRGSARAVQKHNLGPRIKGHMIRRGDAVQLNWKGGRNPETLSGHSVFCYHARRISDEETRFLIVSAQISTFGIGVPLNKFSVEGLALAEGREREPVKHKKTGRKYIDHPEKADGFEDPAYVRKALTHGHYFVANGSESDGTAKSPKGFAEAHVSRPYRPFPCFPISLGGRKTLAFLGEQQLEGADLQPHEVDADRIIEPYYRNTEEGPGGYYPLGTSKTWHGGVHLKPEFEDPSVYAAFDGRVVCARLAPPDPDKYPLGSPNFILLKHALEIDGTEQEFYTLYMHLAQFKLNEWGLKTKALEGMPTVRFQLADDDEDPMPDVPYTLKVGTLSYSGNTDSEGKLRHEVSSDEEFGILTFHVDGRDVEIKVKIQKPEVQEEPTEDEDEEEDAAAEGAEAEEEEPTFSDDPRLLFPWLRDIVLAPEPGTPEAGLDPEKLHLQVKSLPRSGAKIDETELAVDDILEFDPTDKKALNAWYGKSRKGKCKRVLPSGSPEGDLNLRRFPDGGLIVHDAYPAKFADKRKELEEGKVVDFWEDKILVGAGEPLYHVGKASGKLNDEHMKKVLHFELFSEKPIKCWVDKPSVDDSDGNLFIDRKKFAETFFTQLDEGAPELKGILGHMIGAEAMKDDTIVTRQELAQFFKASGDARLFRDLVVKFPSEWSDEAGWDKLGQDKELFGYVKGDLLTKLKEAIKEYVWWDGSLKSDGLPGSKTVVHYHPIRFMAWVNEKREAEAKGGSGAKLHESVYELNHLAP